MARRLVRPRVVVPRDSLRCWVGSLHWCDADSAIGIGSSGRCSVGGRDQNVAHPPDSDGTDRLPFHPDTKLYATASPRRLPSSAPLVVTIGSNTRHWSPALALRSGVHGGGESCESTVPRRVGAIEGTTLELRPESRSRGHPRRGRRPGARGPRLKEEPHAPGRRRHAPSPPQCGASQDPSGASASGGATAFEMAQIVASDDHDVWLAN